MLRNLSVNHLKKMLSILFFLLLVADLSYSFLQYYNMPLDGDMPNSIIPSPDISKVLDDPFATKILTQEDAYPNPNRFFCHWSINKYYNNIPLWLQQFTSPLNSVYLSSAVVKIFVQFLLLFLIAVFVTGKYRFFDFDNLLVMVITVPFFQGQGYGKEFTLIHGSNTYFFFYSFSLLILLLYFLPVILNVLWSKKVFNSVYYKVIWLAFGIVLALSGPLNPPLALIISGLLFLFYLYDHVRFRKFPELYNAIKGAFQSLPRMYYFYIVPIVIFSFYSLIIGFFNTNISYSMPLADMYDRLFQGVFEEFLNKRPFRITLIVILINYLIIWFFVKNQRKRIVLKLYHFVFFAILIFILFLPFGGYREYRPLILRGDTLLPVTFLLVFLTVFSVYFILKNVKRNWLYVYIPIFLWVLIDFTSADKPGFDKNNCERNALMKIAASEQDTVALDNPCRVFSWFRFHKPWKSESKVQVLKRWNVLERDKRYYFVKKTQ